MLVDSHAHLESKEFAADLAEVVDRARRAGVGEILNVGYDPGSIGKTIALTERFEEVYGALGIHPHNAKDYDDTLEADIKKQLLRKKVLAVGEIGLDYYRDLSPRGTQRDVFRRQIGIALYFKKPIVVHCRDAFDDVVRILSEEGAGDAGGIFHAFSGGEEEAKVVLDLGFHIGIGGPLTYRNSRLPRVAVRLPSGAILLETDCPYLPPVPHRGKRNEPAYVCLVAERLAETLGVGTEDIERSTSANYRRLFHGDVGREPEIAYSLKGNIYVNVTGACTNDCVFCPRNRFGRYIYGHNLGLVNDPTAGEMAAAVRELAGGGSYGEIVFCGYGEPTCRLKEMLEAARALGTLGLPRRLDTNGQGNLIHKRDITPELEEVFESVSISLNAHDRSSYERLCRPDFGGKAFDAAVEFIKRAAGSRMDCTVTAVDYEGVDIEACRELVRGIEGTAFRVRAYRFTGAEGRGGRPLRY
jgi:TatD DNase family protein